MKKEGLSARAIGAAFKERYGFRPPSSTMSTFYNRKNIDRYERYVLESTMSHAEFVHNDQQRPAIMQDMEHALIGMFDKAINNVFCT